MIKDEKKSQALNSEEGRGGGGVRGRIPLTQSVLNPNLRAYWFLSGLIGFCRLIELGLYWPRPSSGVCCLSPAYSLAHWEH